MTSLSDLSERLRVQRSRVDRLQGEKDSLTRLHASTEKEIETLQAEISSLELANIFLTSIGEDRQFKAQESIEQLVTVGLRTIFDDSLSFHIIQKVSGKTATVEFVVRSSLPEGRVVETSVLEARGGGLAAVIGFLLRLVVLLLQRDEAKDKVLVLDETFAHVSDEYVPALGEFLRQLKEKTGVQIIMVTHQSEFGEYADKVYRFSLDNGVTRVREEK